MHRPSKVETDIFSSQFHMVHSVQNMSDPNAINLNVQQHKHPPGPDDHVTPPQPLQLKDTVSICPLPGMLTLISTVTGNRQEYTRDRLTTQQHI